MSGDKEKFINMVFEDEIEEDEKNNEVYDEGEDFICCICGNEPILRIGYNKKEQMYKNECKNCGAITVAHRETGKITLIKGEARNWEKYLSDNMEFPFIAQIVEITGREFFNPDDPPPIGYMDIVKVLEVYETPIYGIVAVVQKGRKEYIQPLCFLEAEDINSRNYTEMENYNKWREYYWSSALFK